MRTNKFIDIYFPTLICLAATIAGVYLGLTSGIKSTDELTEIQGKVEQIVFKPRQSRQSPHYDLLFTNYSNVFRVSPDYTDIFQDIDFKKEINKNEIISLKIENDKYDELNTNNTILVYSIKQQNKTYLDLVEVMEIETWNRRVLTPIAGTILFLLTIGVYLYRTNKYG